MKGVPNQFKTRFGGVGDYDLDDIEAKQDLGIIEHAQPGEPAARDSLLFLSIHCFNGSAKIFARPCFYFDKDQRVVVAADNIDLSAAAPFEIAMENFITVPTQEPASQFLSTRAAPEMFWLR